jgi:hypothetical protein
MQIYVCSNGSNPLGSRNADPRGLAVALQPLLQLRAKAALYERR